MPGILMEFEGQERERTNSASGGGRGDRDELGTAALDTSGEKGARLGLNQTNFNASGVKEGKPTTDNPTEVIKPTGTQIQTILPDYKAESGTNRTTE